MTIPAADALLLQTLVTPIPGGTASRVLVKTLGGSVTLFAFDGGQGLKEHASPHEALVSVLEGALTLTIEGTPIQATPGTIVRIPAGVPHAVHAHGPTRMLLVVLRTAGEA